MAAKIYFLLDGGTINWQCLVVFGYLTFSMILRISLSQTVSFSIKDQINDSVVFTGQENVQLSCEINGFSNSHILRIYKDPSELISEGSQSLNSDEFGVSVDGAVTTLTIKVASEETGGLYRCVVSDSTLATNVSSEFNFVVREVNPQCHVRTSNILYYTGQQLTADCFYKHVPSGITVTLKWVRRYDDGSEDEIDFDQVILRNKTRISTTVTDISEADNGTTFICYYSFQIGTLISSDPVPCSIGPIVVETPLTSSSQFSSSFSSTLSSIIVTAQNGDSRMETDSTTKQMDQTTLEDALIYIIAGAVGVLLGVFIIFAICCCCCFNRKPKSKSSQHLQDPDKKADPVEYSNVAEKLQPGDDYDIPPFGYDIVTRKESSPNVNHYTNTPMPISVSTPYRPESMVIPGPDDMASTHL